MSDQKEQTPESERGKDTEQKPEVFIPIPLDRVSLNSQDEGKAKKP
jgi:hypothetical protein